MPIQISYEDESGKLVEISDPSELSIYYTYYDDAQDKDIFEKADPDALKVEKAYADSNIMKITYTGGEIEFSNEYIFTYKDEQPGENFWENSIVVNFSHAVLQEVSTYSSTVASDASYSTEFITDGKSAVDIYAASVDVTDMIFWNTVTAVSLKSAKLVDESGNDLSSSIVTDGNIDFTEESGRSSIYGEKITIPAGTLTKSAKLELTFEITATGGDGAERTYNNINNVYIFYSENAADPGTESGDVEEPVTQKAANPMTLSVTKKTYSRSKDLSKKKSFKIGVKNAEGSVGYTPDSKAKKAGIKVTKKGKVTVPKKCKKGTYKITVTASGNDGYEAGEADVTVKVKKLSKSVF